MGTHMKIGHRTADDLAAPKVSSPFPPSQTLPRIAHTLHLGLCRRLFAGNRQPSGVKLALDFVHHVLSARPLRAAEPNRTSDWPITAPAVPADRACLRWRSLQGREA